MSFFYRKFEPKPFKETNKETTDKSLCHLNYKHRLFRVLVLPVSVDVDASLFTAQRCHPVRGGRGEGAVRARLQESV